MNSVWTKNIQWKEINNIEKSEWHILFLQAIVIDINWMPS